MGLQWDSQVFPCLLTTRPDTNLCVYLLANLDKMSDCTKPSPSPRSLSFHPPTASFTALSDNLQASRKVIALSNWPVRPPPSHTCHSRVLFTLRDKSKGLPWWLSGEEPAWQCQRCRFGPWVGKIPWKRKWQPTPAFFPGKPHGQRSLASCSPWDRVRVGHDLATKQQQQ